jgi:hypothetical protein
MARYTGRNMFIEWTPDGGSAIRLDGDYRTVTLSEEIDSIDATAGADTFKKFIPGLQEVTVDLEMLDNDAHASTFYAAIEPGDVGTLVLGPHGNETGKIKFTIPAMVESREREYPYDDVVTLKVTFKGTGPVTTGTFS